MGFNYVFGAAIGIDVYFPFHNRGRNEHYTAFTWCVSFKTNIGAGGLVGITIARSLTDVLGRSLVVGGGAGIVCTVVQFFEKI